MQFVDNVGPDQCEHPCSLIWVFTVHRNILQYPLIRLQLGKAYILALFVCCASYVYEVDRPCLYHSFFTVQDNFRTHSRL